MPVKIRGKIYASQRDAARSLKLGKNTIWRAIDQGLPDYAGLGKSKERTDKAKARVR